MGTTLNFLTGIGTGLKKVGRSCLDSKRSLKGFYQSDNIKVPKQKIDGKGKRSERILKHPPRSIAYKKPYDHRFSICQVCNIKVSRPTSGTSASTLPNDSVTLMNTADIL
jgi:hypothetical protein